MKEQVEYPGVGHEDARVRLEPIDRTQGRRRLASRVESSVYEFVTARHHVVVHALNFQSIWTLRSARGPICTWDSNHQSFFIKPPSLHKGVWLHVGSMCNLLVCKITASSRASFLAVQPFDCQK